MKNYSLLMTVIVCCAFGLMPNPLYAQGRTLTEEQLETIAKPSLTQCSPPGGKAVSGPERVDPSFIVPTSNAREFSLDRISKTLHGMWRGQVHGDNKEVSVDYFWIVDMKRNEGLVIAQRTGKDSMAALRPLAAAVAKAPKMEYLMCAHQGYLPATDTAQLHEFVKFSDSIEDAPRILEKATGLKFRKAQPTLSDLWQEIVASGYFKGLPAVAFAGALFKPIQLARVASEIGPAQVSLKWNGEYYGGGSTAIKFTPGLPIKGVEYTQFIGTTSRSGDYLVASTGNGKIWKVEAVSGAKYDLGFDSVVLGPLINDR
jgi:hypothetical protein